MHQDDYYKTAFTILDSYYQWIVMSFELKFAPSLFQKEMTRIFGLILHLALIYIDDTLLFSKDTKSHVYLLNQFAKIV